MIIVANATSVEELYIENRAKKMRKMNHLGNPRYLLTAATGLKRASCSQVLQMIINTSAFLDDVCKSRCFDCLLVWSIQVLVNTIPSVTVSKKQLQLKINLEMIINK